MKSPLWVGLCCGVFGVVGLIPTPQTFAEQRAEQEAEVQGRGPLHEAFARPLDEEAKPGPMAPKAPPEPIEEQVPEQKPEGDNMQWVPGYWQWDEESNKFMWITGVWREPPPRRKWVPGTYRQTEQGWQWSPGFWAPEGQDGLNYLPPPPASIDEGPNVEAPDESSNWVPGCWIWRDTRFVWRPGYWLAARPGWIWQPAHYVCSPAGNIFVSGFWDYPLETRGVLFAPVCFNATPRFWTPTFTVGIGCLPSALFVRRGCSSYFFGDYFGADCSRRGYTPWCDYRVGRGGRGACDPLWGHYRGNNIGRSYERDLRGLYADRGAGRVARPPRNLGQQREVLANVGKGGRGGRDIENLTVLRSLSDSAKERKFVNVNKEDRDREIRHSTKYREAANQRAKEENRLVQKGEAPTKERAIPKQVNLDVPRNQRKDIELNTPRDNPNKGRNVERTQPGQKDSKFQTPERKGPNDGPRQNDQVKPKQNFDKPNVDRGFPPKPNVEKNVQPRNTQPNVQPRNVQPRNTQPNVQPRNVQPRSQPNVQPRNVQPRNAPRSAPRGGKQLNVQENKPAPKVQKQPNQVKQQVAPRTQIQQPKQKQQAPRVQMQQPKQQAPRMEIQQPRQNQQAPRTQIQNKAPSRQPVMRSAPSGGFKQQGNGGGNRGGGGGGGKPRKR